jgi:hypothetical protein
MLTMTNSTTAPSWRHTSEPLRTPPDAACCVAAAVYRAQPPEITDQQTTRDRLVGIVMRAVVAAKGDFWKPRK